MEMKNKGKLRFSYLMKKNLVIFKLHAFYFNCCRNYWYKSTM